jgi:hypothetical protein
MPRVLTAVVKISLALSGGEAKPESFYIHKQNSMQNDTETAEKTFSLNREKARERTLNSERFIDNKESDFKR